MTLPHSAPVASPLPVNKANILALASFIASHPELPFDMASPDVPHCGTPGCIGGFAAALWPQCATGEVFDQVATSQQLGLSKPNSEKLFNLSYWKDSWHSCQFEDVAMPVSYRLITRQGACQTLARLATTGQVQWNLHEQTSPDTTTPNTSPCQPEPSLQ